MTALRSTGAMPWQSLCHLVALGALATPVAWAQDLPGSAYRIGGGVSSPMPVYKPDPLYSEEARKAHAWGTVVLMLVVGEDGLPRRPQIYRPLGLGLDEQAVAAVESWRFRPGEKDGKPVAVAATIEINFRLLADKDGWRIGRLVFEGAAAGRLVLVKSELPKKPVPDHDVRISASLKVDRSGRVTSITAEDGSDPGLTAPLLAPARKWKFEVPKRLAFSSFQAAVEFTYGLPQARGTPSPPRSPTEVKTAEEAYREGVRLTRVRAPEQALPFLTKAVQEKPDWDAGYSARAAAYYALKRYPEAIADLTNAIRLSPSQASLYNRRGLCGSYQGHHDLALLDYIRAIELSPAPASAYFNNRGWAYTKLGQLDKAMSDLNKALELAPNGARAYEDRGSAYMSLKDYTHAIADFTAASQLGVTQWQMEQRAEEKRLSGDLEGAAEDLKRAASLPSTIGR